VGTHIQRQVETQHVAASQQLVETDILGPNLFLDLWVQSGAVIVPNLHAKGACLLCHIAADATHTKDAEDFPLGITTQLWERISSPLAFSQSRHADGKVAEGAQEQENSHVCGCIINSRRGIRDADTTVGAGLDVYLVVPCPVMANETDRARERIQELSVNLPSYSNAIEGAVCRHTSVESSRRGFNKEVSAA
jgi:hypothetical protein